jgi:RND family efflux transporter MFP subunit
MNYETGSIGHEERLALPGEPAPTGRARRIVVTVLVVAALVVVGWLLFGRKHEAPTTKGADQMPLVTVVVPGRQLVDRTVNATGTLAAKRDLPVGVAGEGGLVTRVLAEPGQWVKAGQVLATVDRSVQQQTAQSLAAQVAVAKSDQDIAKADLQRKAATRDAAAARVRVAQAALRETQARNGRLDIRAPAAGLVLTRQVEPGQIVSGGSGVLFRMAMDGQLELRAQVAESDLAGLHVGSRATVTPVGSARSFPGTVWQLSPVIDPQTRQGTARVQIAYDPALRPGGFATATIVGGAGQAPILPNSALQSDDKGSFVYIVGKDDKVERRNVKVGEVFDTGITIASGLDGTERVVQSAGGFLSPGQKVKPVVRAATPLKAS